MSLCKRFVREYANYLIDGYKAASVQPSEIDYIKAQFAKIITQTERGHITNDEAIKLLNTFSLPWRVE